MVYKRTGLSPFFGNQPKSFKIAYSFKEKVKNFGVDSEVYALFLGLNSGFYETPTHTIKPHDVNGTMVGFHGGKFNTTIKCKGIREDGTKDETALCCMMAKKEKERIPDKNNSANRIITFTSAKIHIPVLILDNILADPSVKSYPVSKVSLSRGLSKPEGLTFTFIDFAASTFKDLIDSYYSKLVDDCAIESNMDKNTPEYFDEMLKRLSQTVIKIRGISKAGFSAALKSYSFFPFSSPNIALESGEAERNLIINYMSNAEVKRQVSEYLILFDSEADKLTDDWNDTELLQYYNSAVGLPLNTPIDATAPAIVEVQEAPVPEEEIRLKPVTCSGEAFENMLQNVGGTVAPVQPQPLPSNTATTAAQTTVAQTAVPESPIPSVSPVPAQATPDTVANVSTTPTVNPVATVAEDDELNDFTYDPEEDGDFFNE